MPRKARTEPGVPGFSLLAALLAGPAHGYELVARLERLGASEVFPLEPPTLYGHLHSLAESGMVTWREERHGSRPPRKVFELTRSGQEAAEAWLAAPVPRLRQVRQELLLKLALLEVLDRPADRRGLIERQVEVCRLYLSGLADQPAETPVGRLNRGARASAAEATIAWLESLLAPSEVPA
ncbi:MAG: PadR family transcriptional regulator [Tepidiforma sp.]|nr:PadR family transcriptional regulator [Tepidiforma sp.]GIW17281.1 MAG: PadR family transcriptional regulator [Tepidiforma sp.]